MAAIPAGSYNVKKDNKYLAVENGAVVVRGKVFAWTVTVHGDHNCLQDPGSHQYLHDDTTNIVLDPGENKHARWAGASLKKHTKLINDGTESPLNIPYDGEGDTWIFEKAD